MSCAGSTSGRREWAGSAAPSARFCPSVVDASVMRLAGMGSGGTPALSPDRSAAAVISSKSSLPTVATSTSVSATMVE
eukprot:scaffold296210_cov29-Tisochrysis_lutea.AAC.2